MLEDIWGVFFIIIVSLLLRELHCSVGMFSFMFVKIYKYKCRVYVPLKSCFHEKAKCPRQNKVTVSCSVYLCIVVKGLSSNHHQVNSSVYYTSNVTPTRLHIIIKHRKECRDFRYYPKHPSQKSLILTSTTVIMMLNIYI